MHMRREAASLLVRLVLVDWIAMVPLLCWCDRGTFVGQPEIRAVGCIENMTFPAVRVQLKDVKT